MLVLVWSYLAWVITVRMAHVDGAERTGFAIFAFALAALITWTYTVGAALAVRLEEQMVTFQYGLRSVEVPLRDVVQVRLRSTGGFFGSIETVTSRYRVLLWRWRDRMSLAAFADRLRMAAGRDIVVVGVDRNPTS
jgi:hypothetical protein